MGAHIDEGPYEGRSVAEVIHDYAVVRGDLSEQYARDQLARIIEGRIDRAAKRDAAALAEITALATAALADRRRGCTDYGLVDAAQIQRIVESTNHAGDRHG